MTLVERLQARADNAYVQYIGCCRRDECLGWEAKVGKGVFGLAELEAHKQAAEALGRHRALQEITNLLLAEMLSGERKSNHDLVGIMIKHGTEVNVLLDDGTIWRTRTRSDPWQLGHGQWVVALDGWPLGYPLDRVTEAWTELEDDRMPQQQRDGTGSEPFCTWSQDGFGEDHYDTSCGHRFSLDNGASPLENHMSFCCYCGRRLEEVLEEEQP